MFVGAEQYGGRRGEGHRAADDAEQGHAPWDEAGPVHQPAEQQSCAETGAEGGAEQKRLVMDRHERAADHGEGGRVRAGSSGQVLAQGHDGEDADQADDDDGGLEDARGDVAKGEAFALPLDDRKQHDRGADVGDREDDLQERAELHARVSAGTQDVVGVLEQRRVERDRGNRGDEGDDKEHARYQSDPALLRRLLR